MNTIQLTNLISYYSLMVVDNNFSSHITYVDEKFNIFFTNKPNKIDCIEHWLKIGKKDLIFFNEFDGMLQKWGLKTDNYNFDVYYFTFYLIYYSRNNKYTGKLNIILNIFKEFFNNNVICENDLTYVLHPLLREEVIKFKEENNRIFKLLHIKEKINSNNPKKINI